MIVLQDFPIIKIKKGKELVGFPPTVDIYFKSDQEKTQCRGFI